MNRSGYFKPLLALLLAASVVLFSTKAGGHWLSVGLERTVTPVAAPAATAAQAIVVMNGGHWRNREAVRLQRATGLPVLASGEGGEAAAFKREPERDFGVPVWWTEGESLTAEENALFSAKILVGARVQEIFLLMHALHMPRAEAVFGHRPRGDCCPHGFFERSCAAVDRFLAERRRLKNQPIGAA